MPFSYTELMGFPTFMIEKVFALMEKEYDRKIKAAKNT